MWIKLLKLLIFILFYLIFISPPCIGSAESDYKVVDWPAKFNVESTVFLNDVAGRDKEAGFKIKSTLTVEPIWKKSNELEEYLLKFQIASPRIWTRRIIPNADFSAHPSGLDSHTKITSLIHMTDGIISNIYTQTDDKHVVNYVRSLASLFQLKWNENEQNETDISGTCHVVYETLSPQVFRKYKHSCAWSSPNPLESTYLTKYTTDNNQLKEIFAEELHQIQADSAESSPGVKARVWVHLVRVAWSGGSELVKSFESALGEWQTLHKYELPLDVALSKLEAAESLSDVISQHRKGLLCVSEESEEIDGVMLERAAEAIARVVLAVNADGVKVKHIEQVLDDVKNRDILWGVLLSIGASGSVAGLHATGNALKSDAEQHRYLMKHYLAALATSHHANDELILEVLKLYGGKGVWSIWSSVANEAIVAAAQLTNAPHVTEQTKIAVKEATTKGLSKCKDNECRAVHLRAIGNLRMPETIELLLQSAERGTETLAALDALHTIDAHAFTAKHIRRLAEISMRPYKIDSCTSAMHLGMRLAAEHEDPLLFPFDIIAFRLEKYGPFEQKKMFWQLFSSLSEEYPILRRMHFHMLDNYKALSNWNARAHQGLSTAMSRHIRGPLLNASLTSVQSAANTALRRALVMLHVHQHGGKPMQLFSVDVRTQGLESLGGSSSSTEDTEDLSASLYVNGYDGARATGIQLFNGQSQLLGHVWSGTASTPTRAATRAIVRSTNSLLPTAAGIALRVIHQMCVVLDLAGQAQVSLWNRVADTKLFLRGGVYLGSSMSTVSEWSLVSINVNSYASPALTVAAIIDFSDNVRICVNTRTHDYAYVKNMTKSERVPMGTHRTLRQYDTRTPVHGITLALDENNKRHCNDMTN